MEGLRGGRWNRIFEGKLQKKEEMETHDGVIMLAKLWAITTVDSY